MRLALEELEQRWRGKRRPKAFYLGPDDWADFMATEPLTVRARRGDDWSDEPSFFKVPVRASKNVPPRQSRLYDHASVGHALPDTPPREKRDPKPAAEPKGCQDIPAADVFNSLDALSRTRALTDYESELLEEAMNAMNAAQWNLRLNGRDAARYGVKRDKDGKFARDH